MEYSCTFFIFKNFAQKFEANHLRHKIQTMCLIRPYQRRTLLETKMQAMDIMVFTGSDGLESTNSNTSQLGTAVTAVNIVGSDVPSNNIGLEG